MTTTSTTTDPRADRARFIASTASQWLKCHTLGGKRYGVPSESQPGRYFLVDTRVCDSLMVSRVCEQCGRPISVSQRRLELGRGRFCSKACQHAAQITRAPRVCAHCGAPFAAPRYLVKKGYGRYCSRSCGAAASHPGPLPPRDGDRQQARRSVRSAIQRGERSHPDALPCTDCGHVWQPGDPHHNYDHYLGYSAAHHLDVQPVCPRCHYGAIARGERGPRFRARRRPAAAFERWLLGQER